MSTEEQRAKWREAWARRWADPEYREKRKAYARKYFRKKYQSDPEFRARHRAYAKAARA